MERSVPDDQWERITPNGQCDGCGAFEGRRSFFLCNACLDERLDAAQARRQLGTGSASPGVAPVSELDHQRMLGELRSRWLGRGVEHR